MAIIVTQQYVDVLGPGAADARVGRQYIEVLHAAGSTSTSASASSTISFSHTATGKVLDQSVESTLNLSQILTTSFTYNVSASSTLAFNSSIIKTTAGVASSTLSFVSTEGHFNYVDDRKVGESTLALTHLAVAGGFDGVDSELDLTQDVSVRGPVFANTETRMFLTDVARSLNKYVSASDKIVFTGYGAVPITYTVTHTLNLTDLGYMSFADSVLAFTQTAEAGKGPGIPTQEISFTQDVITHGIFRRTVVTDLGITQSFTYYEDAPCLRKQYTPFIGNASDSAPSTDLPLKQYTGEDRFIMYYPSRGERVTEVVLRAPLFGDRDRNAYTRINRESRGGDLIVYADPNWPSIRNMLVTITGITKTEADAYLDFVYTYLGQQIGITDWQGRQWEGVILNPNEPAVNDSKDKWTITFDFEGELLGVFAFGNQMDLSLNTDTGKDPGANSEINISQELGGAKPEGTRETSITFLQKAEATI